ncbi:ABC transporter substrate-binding protein [Paenibacillus sp. GYB004]|uniref:ABC transporter substrate-binding protein n=1 Tax=Paenibacillus sp. GYB004 TaxID=2994393 RepID=UPI002F966D06
MNNKRELLAVWLILTFVLVLVGCEAGGKSEKGKNSDSLQPAADKPKEPVTLTFYNPNSGDLKEDWMAQYGNAIQKKFPHITVNYVQSPDTNPAGHLANMISAQEPIDVILNADTNHYRLITPFKFEYDMTELVKKHNFDLNRLEQSTVDAVRALSKGGLYALPFKMNVLSLMYNKDLFDKFGVPYPKDGMTWDETYELAKTMTRKEGETQYRGFLTQSYNIAWMNQMSLGFADPKSDKPLLYSDDRWGQFVRNFNRFYEIPGNALAETNFRGVSNAFLVNKVAAMYAYTIPTTKQDVNWDMVSLPEFSHLRGVGSQAMLTLAYVTSISKHKDDAFEAIAYMTSDEYQMNISKQALGLPVVKTPAVKDAFGIDNPNLQGKNLKSLTSNKPAAPFQQSAYQAITNNQLEKIWYQLGKGQMDVNTALRTASEMAEKEIANLKSSGQ